MNDKAQKNLNEKLQKMEEENQPEEVEEMSENEIMTEFDNLYNRDPELQ